MWIPSSKITCKCDVYSFGILLFEILGRRSISQSDKWFPKEVWKKFEIGRLEDIISDCDIVEESIEKAKALSMVAFWCIQFASEMRPPMSTVAMMLEKPIIIDEPPYPFPQEVSSLAKISSGLFSESLLKQIYPERSSNSIHNTSTPERNVSIREEERGYSTKVTISKNPSSSYGRKSDSMLESFEKRCPPGGENSVILYTTSLEATKSFERCNEVLSILRSHGVKPTERDLFADSEYKMELRGLQGAIELPALFVKGRFIGGADQVVKMEEEGNLSIMFDDVNEEQG